MAVLVVGLSIFRVLVASKLLHKREFEMGLFFDHNLPSADGLELVTIHHLLSGPYRNYQVTSPFAGLSHGKLPLFLKKIKM